MSKLDSAKKARLSGWFGCTGWRLRYISREDSEAMQYPKCSSLAEFWYIDVVLSSDLEYLDCLTSHRCTNTNCDWQRFYYE